MYPRRVWFDTGDGWASREIMPPDDTRRDIISYVCGDREICHSNGKPRELLPDELDAYNKLAAKMRGYCREFEKTNEERKCDATPTP